MLFLYEKKKTTFLSPFTVFIFHFIFSGLCSSLMSYRYGNVYSSCIIGLNKCYCEGRKERK